MQNETPQMDLISFALTFTREEGQLNAVLCCVYYQVWVCGVWSDFSDLKLRPISCDISAGRIFIILTSTLHNITANQDITASTSK